MSTPARSAPNTETARYQQQKANAVTTTASTANATTSRTVGRRQAAEPSTAEASTAPIAEARRQHQVDTTTAPSRLTTPTASSVNDASHSMVPIANSRPLAPALRLGWLVLPTSLRADVVARKRLTDLGYSPLPQAAFARLLRTGGYDRHLRRTRLLYRRRRDALLAAVAEHLPGWQPVGIAAGLHVLLRLPDGVDDSLVQQRIADRGGYAPALS
jgi:hypothetical protein